ncbi:MAG: MarR family transcriptional regulator [Clostridia bacterium]|nr:MarR family transcriptional regulator [Clostridia bacterium]
MKQENTDLLRLENQLCFPLYAASREVIKQYHPYLDELGLTYTQYIAMMVFWEKKTTNVKELGNSLFLDSGTLTPVLKSLEGKGLVRRRRSELDERMLVVEITPEGEALKEKAKDVPIMMMQHFNLPVEDAMELYRLLYKLLGREKE